MRHACVYDIYVEQPVLLMLDGIQHMYRTCRVNHAHISSFTVMNGNTSGVQCLPSHLHSQITP